MKEGSARAVRCVLGSIPCLLQSITKKTSYTKRKLVVHYVENMRPINLIVQRYGKFK
jgi:DTW domain-containing protein YfiP|nr:MAG TPA: hypothetical protein [Caudoviricetes sp.]